MSSITDASAALTVVVPFVNRWSDLEGCLTALAEQEGAAVHVIVAERLGGDVAARIRERFPETEVLSAPPGTTIPDLRAMAFDRAHSPSVAVIEDHVVVPRDWAKRMLAARETARVVGGAVANAASERWVDEAAFLCEYSHLLPPIPAGVVDGITGNNTVYDRALLEKHHDVTHAGLWENHLHDAIRADGVDLVCHPDIVVGHKMHYTVGLYLSQRYLYSRSYAGARAAASPFPKRMALALASFALPPLLLMRIVRRCLDKGVDRGVLLRSLPLLALFVGGWAWGEVVGSLLGPGDALSRIR
ncbi:MAG: glycosyltransferase [Gemmatimonadota bacterium]